METSLEECDAIIGRYLEVECRALGFLVEHSALSGVYVCRAEDQSVVIMIWSAPILDVVAYVVERLANLVVRRFIDAGLITNTNHTALVDHFRLSPVKYISGRVVVTRVGSTHVHETPMGRSLWYTVKHPGDRERLCLPHGRNNEAEMLMIAFLLERAFRWVRENIGPE